MLSCRFGEVDAYGKAGHRGTPTCLKLPFPQVTR